MFFQRIFAWLLLPVLLGVLLYELIAGDLLRTPAWTSSGLLRWSVFCCACSLYMGVWIALRPRWLPWALAALAGLITIWSAGPLALLSVVYVLPAWFALGCLWLQRREEVIEEAPQAVLLLGAATWSVLLSLTAHWKIHYWWSHALVLALPMVLATRRQWWSAWRNRLPHDRSEAAILAIPALPLLSAWAYSFRPEVHGEAITQQLAVMAAMTSQHAWAFDPLQAVWALWPKGATWLYSSVALGGGEAAARLLSPVLLAVLCWMLKDWIHRMVRARLTAVLVAAFAATPLIQTAGSSINNLVIAMAFMGGATAFFRRYLRHGQASVFTAACVLAGAAAGVSFAGGVFALCLFAGACVTVSFSKLWRGLLIGGAMAWLPYQRAWLRTGNPVYPFFNTFFRAPGFPVTTDFSLPAPGHSVWWRALYDLTFHTQRYLESHAGAIGVLFFLFAPLCIIAARRKWPRIGWINLWIWMAGSAFTVALHQPGDSVLIAYPLFIVSVALAVATFRSHSNWMELALTGLASFALVLHLVLLAGGSPAEAGFSFEPRLEEGQARRFLAAFGPERPLVDRLNATDSTARAAWLENANIADFRGTALTNAWPTPSFQQRLHNSASPEGHYFVANDLQLRYFIAPSPESDSRWTNVFFPEFLGVYTDRVLRFGPMELRRMKATDQTAPLSPPVAGPGRYDEVNQYVHFDGPWIRDFQFERAYLGTLAYTNDARAHLTVRFRGSAITLLHTAAANRCSGTMALEDGVELPLAEYSATTRWQARAQTVRTSPGEHALTLSFPPTPEAAMARIGCYLDLDGFIIE